MRLDALSNTQPPIPANNTTHPKAQRRASRPGPPPPLPQASSCSSSKNIVAHERDTVSSQTFHTRRSTVLSTTR
jgi:hypothetical protein